MAVDLLEDKRSLTKTDQGSSIVRCAVLLANPDRPTTVRKDKLLAFVRFHWGNQMCMSLGFVERKPCQSILRPAFGFNSTCSLLCRFNF